MHNLKNRTPADIIAECVNLDKELKELKRQSDACKAELQARAISIMEDKNIRYVKFYGSSCAASVTDAMKLELLNITQLKKIFTEGLVKEQIAESIEVKYKPKPNFEKALKAIFTGDYIFEMSLEELLDQMSVKPDAKQKKLLLKHLKGDYEKDKATLLIDLGYMNKEDKVETVQAPDFDVELWMIYRIKNAELIRTYLPEGTVSELLEKIRRCIIVDSKTAITIDYDKEKTEDKEDES